MITLRELVANLYAVIGLLRLDDRAFGWFDASLPGFWRSFWAAGLALPGFALLAAQGHVREGLSASLPAVLIAELSAYVMSWVAWPLLCVYLVPGLGAGGRLFTYLVPYNWFRVAEIAALLPVAALAGASGLPGLAGFLLLLMTAGILFFEGWIARKALDVPMGTAALMVFADLLLHLFIDAAKGAVLG